MQLNRENYEAFMLDYLEGNLSPSAMMAFKVFLEENPDLKTDIFQTGRFRLRPNPAYFHHKELLKKMPLAALEDIPEPDKSCIASIEKDLPEAEMILFKEKVNRDTSVQETMKSYEKVVLKGDPVIFPGKRNLKKPVFLIPSRVYLVGSLVAAGILLLFLFKFFLFPIRPSDSSMVSDASLEKPANTKQKTTGTIEQSSPIPMIKIESNIIAIRVNSTVKRGGLTAKNPARSKRTARLGMINPLLSPATNARPEVFRGSFSTSRLKIPVLYLTEQLGEEELRAIENYPIEKFKLKILTPARLDDTYPPFWVTLANLGVKGINKLARWNMELKPAYNDQGDLSVLAFHSGVLNFSTNLKKNKPE